MPTDVTILSAVNILSSVIIFGCSYGNCTAWLALWLCLLLYWSLSLAASRHIHCGQLDLLRMNMAGIQHDLWDQWRSVWCQETLQRWLTRTYGVSFGEYYFVYVLFECCLFYFGLTRLVGSICLHFSLNRKKSVEFHKPGTCMHFPIFWH